MSCAEITVFTKSGGLLTKIIHLTAGKIANDSAKCRMPLGSARRVKVDLANLEAFADLINSFTAQQAYALGRLKDGLPERVKVTTADKSPTRMAIRPSSPAR